MNERPVAIVTGGTRGIGRAIAVELATLGYDLVISHRGLRRDSTKDPSPAHVATDAIEATGAMCLCLAADVANTEDRQRLVDETRERFGRCDMLVNNAGVAPIQRVDLLQASEESFDHVMSINLRGPYFLTQLVANWMVEQKAADEHFAGRIVNISSISAYTASPARGEYCLSKAGMAMMTKLYASRLGEYGLGVFEIRPGIIETDMTAGVMEKYETLIAEGLTPLRRWGHPQDIANAVGAIASGTLDFATGAVLDVDGGFHIQRL
jgi:3-oxoacyl-[acyl-carrier protein] reductase